jgi:pyruvate dehydrogenase E2 component (dihydrolipoamide acetyltransferase)
MPRQGNTVESCVLVGWHAKEGASIAAADLLCEVETDKAVFEVPAGFDGIVLKLLVAEGDDVPVLEPIAVIGEAGEDWKSAVPSAVGAAGSAAAAATTPVATQGATNATAAAPVAAPSTAAAAQASAPAQAAVLAQAAGPASGVSPRARVLAAHEAVNPAGLSGSGPGGRVLEKDVRAAVESRGMLSASARAAAAGSLAGPVQGSGPGGRILLADLEKAAALAATAAEQTTTASVAGTGAPAGAGAAAGAMTGAATLAGADAKPLTAAGLDFPGAFTETPIKSIRKVIADRMRQSLATTAQYTLHASAPAARLQGLRARMKASPAALGLGGVTVGDIVLYITSRVLKAHPLCNSLKLGDTVKTFERVHLGLAVDTPRGLMVPVIRNADLLSLEQISSEAKRLAAACIEGKAAPDELSGSTFTVSNLGALGVDYFTPVINTPEVCVLGVGAILPKAQVETDGSYAIGPALGLSLTADHQVVDGAPGARFLKDLCAALADADLWIAK